MNEKVLHTLEYNKILDQLTEYAFSADARSRCQKAAPDHRPRADRTAAATDIGCLKPAVQIRLPVLFGSYGHP